MMDYTISSLIISHFRLTECSPSSRLHFASASWTHPAKTKKQ